MDRCETKKKRSLKHDLLVACARIGFRP